MPKTFYKGQKLTIVWDDDAEKSLGAAEAGVPGNQRACPVQLKRLIARLADFGELKNVSQFRNEGDGIWAIKARCGLRAYGFYMPGGRFVVSHFVLKREDKMAKRDHELALENKIKYEQMET